MCVQEACPLFFKTMRKIDYLVIHTTASPLSWTWETVRRYFLQILRHRVEGYHVVIEPNGLVKRLVDNERIANGIRPFKSNDIDISNNNSVHIAWIGGIDSRGNGVDNRTALQSANLLDVIRWYVRVYPDIKVLGHNQVANKFCPCFSVPRFLRSFGFDEKNIYTTDNFNVLKWNKL